jgi:transcriptional regulator with XRE-family HTH domain
MATVTDQEAINTFSANLRRLAESRGLTQADIARATGESTARINHYWSGKRQPTIGIASRLAALLGVSVDSLLLPDKPPKNSGKTPRKSA